MDVSNLWCARYHNWTALRFIDKSSIYSQRINLYGSHIRRGIYLWLFIKADT